MSEPAYAEKKDEFMETNGDLTFKPEKVPLMRRVQGAHDLRMDGMGDLLSRARGASVFDVGCNRGMAGFEFAYNGATRVMGCDIWENGVITARQVFADLRSVPHRFEVVDLKGGEHAIRKAFGRDAERNHTFTLLLATYHKLKRIMDPRDLSNLMKFLGSKTERYFAWRGYDEEIPQLDKDLAAVGLTRVHTSRLSDIQPCAIWRRGGV